MIKETFDYIVRLSNISIWYYIVAIGIGAAYWLRYKRLPMAALITYLLIVFSIAVLSRRTSNRPNNFILFKTYKNGIDKQILTNIILFLPVGFFLAYISRKLLWIGPLLSLTIELSQLLLHRGMFDADDILSNTIGEIIGMVIAYILMKVYKSNKLV